MKTILIILLSCNICMAQVADKFNITSKESRMAVANAEKWLTTYSDSIKLNAKVKFVFETLVYETAEWTDTLHGTEFTLQGEYTDKAVFESYYVTFRFNANLNIISVLVNKPDSEVVAEIPSDGAGSMKFKRTKKG